MISHSSSLDVGEDIPLQPFKSKHVCLHGNLSVSRDLSWSNCDTVASSVVFQPEHGTSCILELEH
jgi:hypothetical protein